MNKFSPICLVADIGNSNIKIGLAHLASKKVLRTFSIPTKSLYTPDSLGLMLLQFLNIAKVTEVTSCRVCSVVPDLTNTFRDACEQYLQLKVQVFPHDFELDFKNSYTNPHEVGADRLLAAFAASRLYPQAESIISVDFGTATTFDCVSNNTYLGGLICPGVYSSQQALARGTAQLPQISLELHEKEPCVGKNTVTSMSHGFVFGFVSMTEGLCRRLSVQLPGNVIIIGTGGFAKDIARLTDCIHYVQPDLIFNGLLLASQDV